MVTPNNSLSVPEITRRINDFESLALTDFSTLKSEDLVGLDFSVQTLNGSNFNGMNLPHLQASEAKLVSASFLGTNLTNACFAGADLRGADFTGANITFADFSNAILDSARFSNCGGIESTNLPDSIKRAYRHLDPAFRRYSLIRASIIGGGLVVLSGTLIFMGAAVWSPLAPARQQLDQLQNQIAKEQNQLEELMSRRKTAEQDIARLHENVMSEQKLLTQLKNESWKTRNIDSSNSAPLTRETVSDLAGSLNQLLTSRPSSVQKYVLYFESLGHIEARYGSAGRNEVVQALISRNNEKNQAGFREFLRISAQVKGPVSQTQIEQVLQERYDHNDSDQEEKQTFWTMKSDWTRYWTERFTRAGLL